MTPDKEFGNGREALTAADNPLINRLAYCAVFHAFPLSHQFTHTLSGVYSSDVEIVTKVCQSLKAMNAEKCKGWTDDN